MALYLGTNKVKLRSQSAIQYSVIGSPTITSDGVASGFTDKTDYLTLGAFNPNTNKWAFTTKVKFNSLSANMSLIDRNSSTRCFQIAMRTNGKFRVNISINGSSKANEVDGSHVWAINTIYYLRFEYDGSKYYLRVSTDNINWTTDITINRSDKIYPVSTMSMGHSWYNSGTEKWNGEIYLRYTRFEIDGVTNDKYKLHALEGDYAIVDDRLVWANLNIYLQNINTDATNFIDTGVSPNSNWLVETVYSIQEGNTYTNIYGTRGGGLEFYFNSTSSSMWGSSRVSYSPTVPLNIKTKIIQSKDGLYINGELKSTYTQNDFDLSQYVTMSLFGERLNSSVVGGKQSTLCKIYYHKIFSNNSLIRHFVPVPTGLQIGDFTVPSNGMFDIVNQQFYPNQGTGSFTLGKDDE